MLSVVIYSFSCVSHSLQLELALLVSALYGCVDFMAWNFKVQFTCTSVHLYTDAALESSYLIEQKSQSGELPGGEPERVGATFPVNELKRLRYD